jgi:hypothetical protein
MNESQLVEDIREALDETTASLRVPPGAAARARSRGQRRRAGRGLLALVPAAAVITGVAVLSHGGSTPAREVSAAPRPSVTMQSDAYVTRQVEAVLATANNYIIATSATSGPGQITTSYLDPMTGTTRSVVSGAGDKVTYWVQTSVSGNEDQWRTTYVDNTNHTWWTKLAAKADAVHYWVNATTYQPIQLDLPPFTAASTITESWIPKTPAIVTQTDKPQIPAGYRQIPPSTAFN